MQVPVAEAESVSPDHLCALARQIDAVQTSRSSREPLRAQAAWTAVLAGEWNVFLVFEHNGRTLMVGRRKAEGRAAPLLTPREIQVLGLRARAYGVKLIAAELRMSQATVSRTLTVGLRKLGLRAPTDLVRFATPDPKAYTTSRKHSFITPSIPTVEQLDLTLPLGSCVAFFETDQNYIVLSYPLNEELPPMLPQSLSQAEREVLLALVSGTSPSDIAKARRTSPSTVANQVQSRIRSSVDTSRSRSRRDVNFLSWIAR